MPTNAQLTDEYLKFMSETDAAGEGRRAAREYMNQSTAIYHHEVVDSSYVPRLFNKETYERFASIAETTYSILSKVMREYLENPEYRHVYKLDPRLEELILLPRGYDALLPFARVDLFLNEDDMSAQFCEFNADGSSGMNENREITNSILGSKPYGAFSSAHRVRTCNEELFEGWVDEFLNIYGTYDLRVGHPHVAIVDFLENAITEEFKIFAGLFEKRGIECSVYDVRELRYEGDKLVGRKAFYGRDHAEIDAIWRRSVTNDIIDNWEQSQALVNAVRDRKVALIGSFAGHLVHDKQIFQVLYMPETQALLTDEENEFVRETVPFTSFLTSDAVDIADVKANREKWIIKPTDAYGAHDVFAGEDYDDAYWASIVDAHVDGKAGAPFLIQRYCVPFNTMALPLYGNEEDYAKGPQPYKNMEGLYIYNGRFTGVFSRLGPEPVICKRTGGITAATIWVDE